MDELFAQVLAAEDLCMAADLFSLEDAEIERDLEKIIQRIEEIADTEEYEKNANDQSVVAMYISRITIAIRETDKIESHAVLFVRLLSMCLRHNLAQGARDENPPHAKIALNVMNHLFNYSNNASFLGLVIPSLVSILDCNNKDLVCTVVSFLSHAAVDNGHLVAQQMTVVLAAVLKGNYQLVQLLPHIYDLNPGPVLEHVDQLVELLHTCSLSEKVSLFFVFYNMVKGHPQLLEKHVPLLCTYLSSPLLSTTILMILVDIALSRPNAVVDQLTAIKATVEIKPMSMYQVAQIVGAVGTISKEEAERSMTYLASHLWVSDHFVLPSILQQMRALGLTWPDLLSERMDKISKLSSSGSCAVRLVVQQIQEDFKKHNHEPPQIATASSDPPDELSDDEDLFDNWPPDDEENLQKLQTVRVKTFQDSKMKEVLKKEYENSCKEGQKNYYPLTHKDRGLCLIISNEKFQHLGQRVGNQKDMLAANTLFSGLGFDCLMLKDLISERIEERIKAKVVERDHSNSDCFVLVILSHGAVNNQNEDVVFGTDGQFDNTTEEPLNCVKVDWIKEIVCSIPSLQHKPKLFFIQACRGKKNDKGLSAESSPGPKQETGKENTDCGESDTGDSASSQEVETGDRRQESGDDQFGDIDVKQRIKNAREAKQLEDNVDGGETKELEDNVDANRKSTPTYADLYVSFSTMKGYVSYRNTISGTWYFQAVVWVFSQFAYKKQIHDLMIKVADLVSRGEVEKSYYKQVSDSGSTMRRKFHFFPGLSQED